MQLQTIYPAITETVLEAQPTVESLETQFDS
jgi:hypothetical protein